LSGKVEEIFLFVHQEVMYLQSSALVTFLAPLNNRQFVSGRWVVFCTEYILDTETRL